MNRPAPSTALLLLLLAACGAADKPVTTAPGPTCDPTITVSPTLVGLAGGETAPLIAAVVPCQVAKRVSWIVTDSTIARVASSSDTTALVTGVHAGNTTVVGSVAAFPGAHAVTVVQVH